METGRDKQLRTADSISIRGFSHKNADKPCQDSSTAWMGDNYCAAIVCDGHGGDKYFFSADGSRTACELGRSMISEFMEEVYAGDVCKLNTLDSDSLLSHLEQTIISAWRSRIEKKISKKSPLESGYFKRLEPSDQESLRKNPVKAYGTTFIACVMTDDFCFVLQLGDGNALLIHKDDMIEVPSELDDDTLQFNLTTSMCNSDAAQCFRHCYRENDNNGVCGITLTSDGIINSFRTQSAYESFIRNAYDAFSEDEIRAAEAELKEALNKLSERGSGDDLSFAIVRR